MATRMTRCGFCRRLTCERAEAGPADRGQETAPCENGPLLPEQTLIGETYCHDCDRFYQQLLTFGRGDAPVANWRVPDPPALETSQAKMRTGPTA